MVSILWGDFSIASSTFSLSALPHRSRCSVPGRFGNSTRHVDMAPNIEKGHRYQDGGDEDQVEYPMRLTHPPAGEPSV
jgi:hypothetical protein